MKWIKPFDKMTKLEKLIHYDGYYRGFVSMINQLRDFTDGKTGDILLSDMKKKLDKYKRGVDK